MSLLKLLKSKNTGIQLFYLIRFASTFLMAVLLGQVLGDFEIIGKFEKFLLIKHIYTGFWTAALMNALFPFYLRRPADRQSDAISAALVLFLIFGVIFGLLAYFTGAYSVPGLSQTAYLLIAIVLFLESLGQLSEQMLWLKNKTPWILVTGVVQYGLFVLMAFLPLYWGYSIEQMLGLLVVWSGLKVLLTLFLLKAFYVVKLKLIYLKSFFVMAAPILFSLFMNKITEQTDSIIINYFFDEAAFSIYRYGARELPFVIILTAVMNVTQSGSMAKRVQQGEQKSALQALKSSALKLMHFAFPLSMVLLFLSPYLYPLVFGTPFKDAAFYFNIYLLLLVSRTLFAQTVCVGFNQHRILYLSSFVELVVNFILSYLAALYVGMEAVAAVTVIVHYLEKGILVVYLKRKKIALSLFHPLKWWAFYSLVLWFIFGITYLIHFR